MALTANHDIDRFVDQELRSYGVAAGAHVFRGAFVELNAGGFLIPSSASGRFVGIAYEEADNSSGSDGDASARVFTQGDFCVPLVGATEADIGRIVCAIDDETATFSAQGATCVGFVQGIESAGRIILRLAPPGLTSASRLDHHAATFAVTVGMSGATLTNLGATGVITATLPSSAPIGTTYQFVCMEDQQFRIKPPSGGAIFIKGAKQADGKYAAISDIGDFVEVVSAGSDDWVAVASIGGADADIAIEA